MSILDRHETILTSFGESQEFIWRSKRLLFALDVPFLILKVPLNCPRTLASQPQGNAAAGALHELNKPFLGSASETSSRRRCFDVVCNTRRLASDLQVAGATVAVGDLIECHRETRAASLSGTQCIGHVNLQFVSAGRFKWSAFQGRT